ncbi:MAG TPA: hypothetical protein PLV83_00135 [Bacilli bacterium]|nr:hypothetical protein [Bacilli bacterium]
MKKIKCRIILSLAALVLSIAGLVVAVIYDNSFGIGFCSSIIGSNIVMLYRLSKISKDANKAKEYEILEKDERLKSIANEAKAFTLNCLLIILLSIGLVGYFIKNDLVLMIPTYTALVGVIIYLITTAILNKTK